jgi:hypothetical protein
MSDRPTRLILRAKVPDEYGIEARQLRRLCEEGGPLSRVYLAGPSGAVYLIRAELDALIEESTVPPGQKAGRQPRKG